MSEQELHVVTGAYGYSGKYMASRLLEKGHRVRTLTNSINRDNPFGDKVEAHPYHFDDTAKLVASLRGASVFYNTYWVRFDYGDFDHGTAVENTFKLFDACRQAGVRRVVHVSITNPSLESDLSYFRGKAELEQALIDSGLSYAILRPAVLFGKEDVLINNIAWALRHLPVFGIFGDGRYRLQPIYVDDLAGLAVAQGVGEDDIIIDAIGPEAFTFLSLVQTIGRLVGKTRPLIFLPPSLAYLSIRLLGQLVGDVILTREEIEGLMQGRLYTGSPPAGQTRLTGWARAHAAELGRDYSSELARRKNRQAAYEEL